MGLGKLNQRVSCWSACLLLVTLITLAGCVTVHSRWHYSLTGFKFALEGNPLRVDITRSFYHVPGEPETRDDTSYVIRAFVETTLDTVANLTAVSVENMKISEAFEGPYELLERQECKAKKGPNHFPCTFYWRFAVSFPRPDSLHV